MNAPQLPADDALTQVTGYLATKAMEPVSMELYELESEADRAREDAARPGPTYRIAAGKSARLVGVNLPDPQLDRASLGFHYGLAVSWAPVHALLRRRRPHDQHGEPGRLDLGRRQHDRRPRRDAVSVRGRDAVSVRGRAAVRGWPSASGLR